MKALLASGAVAIGIGLLACSSTSSSSGGQASCGDIAACYSQTVSVDPNSQCSGLFQNTTVDFTSLTSDGTIPDPQCTIDFESCVLKADCVLANGTNTHQNLTFSSSGYSGSITATTADNTSCTAQISGTRLSDCPAVDAGGDASVPPPVDSGVDSSSTPLANGSTCSTSSECSSGCCLVPNDQSTNTCQASGAGGFGCACTGNPECAAIESGATCSPVPVDGGTVKICGVG